MLESALWIARRGLPVFPLNWIVKRNDKLSCSCGKNDCRDQGKHPYGLLAPHGLTDATTGQNRIQVCWTRAPHANIGVATGDIIVLDVDPRHHGDESLRALERKYGEIERTPRSLTGGGGEHIFFKSPADVVIKNSASKLGPGIDVRGVGGYIVGPPSRHLSGRRYCWSVDHHPDDVDFAPVPDWIVAALREPTIKAATPPSEWRKLVASGVTQGNRDCTVTKLTGHLLRRYVDPLVALELMQAWNAARCTPPLPPDDVQRIVNSIAGKELRRRSE
jgi:hypothetical protein